MLYPLGNVLWMSYKIEKSKIFQNPKKIEFILAMCFAITGAPKDILVYIGGLLPVKPIRFILISTFCRLPSIVSSTIVGEYFSEKISKPYLFFCHI